MHMFWLLPTDHNKKNSADENNLKPFGIFFRNPTEFETADSGQWAVPCRAPSNWPAADPSILTLPIDSIKGSSAWPFLSWGLWETKPTNGRQLFGGTGVKIWLTFDGLLLNLTTLVKSFKTLVLDWLIVVRIVGWKREMCLLDFLTRELWQYFKTTHKSFPTDQNQVTF